MKRRTFINSVVQTSIGLASAPFYNIIVKRKADKLGVALVGLGNYATGQLGPALLQTQNCYLAGIVTGTSEKEGIWAEKYNIPSQNIYNYDNYDEIASNDDIDIIYVVLPNSMHAEYTIRGLEAGKHVICEKPMSTKYSDAVQMNNTARKRKKKLGIGYRLHFDPFNLEMMRLGQREIHGAVNEIEAGFGFTLRDKKRWRIIKELSGGGPLMDVGIYAFQGVLYTLGELPKSVRALDTTIDKEFYGDLEGSLEWVFNFKSGIKSKLVSSYENGFYCYLRAKAEKASFGLDPAYIYSGLKGQVDGNPMNIQPINQQAAQMDVFAYSILENTKYPASGELGARDMFLIERIYESMYTNKEVKLKRLPKVQHLI